MNLYKNEYTVKLETLYNRVTDEYCWVHTRGGVIPGENPVIVATTQQWAMGKSDIFSDLFHFRTLNMGESWEGPFFNKNLGRKKLKNGLEMGICDQTPDFHKKTGKLLSTGHTITYDGGAHPASAIDKSLPIYPAYTVYNCEENCWSDWKIIESLGRKNIVRSSSGCSQRYDLDDGTILLPVSFLEKGEKYTKITIARCFFDGEELKVIETGNDLAIESDRGLAEASITKFGELYYLTIRHDKKGYVCISKDGLNFNSPVSWKWDTGVEVETYNTQSHWITRNDGLYLTYTRNAGNNSHVFRHRAPLFMAKVDHEKVCLLRHSEKIIIPERGARLGNFNTTNINENETWIFNTEVLSPPDCTRYGSDGSIFVARIQWI